MSCIVKGCRSHTSRLKNTNESVGFHRFPKNEAIKTEWNNFVSKPNWTFQKSSRICSKHFTEDSFIPNGNTKWRRLKPDAIPTLGIVIKKEETDMKPSSSEENTKKTPPSNILKRKISSLDSSSKKNNEATNKKRIKILEKELAKAKYISKRRLRKINTLTKKVTRLSHKNVDLYKIVFELLKQGNVDPTHVNMLNSINKNDIIKRFLQKQGGDMPEKEYSLGIKKFAVTLHFLSPKAYTFVREQFENLLPHPKSITAWYNVVDNRPEFTTEALKSLLDEEN